MFEISSSEASDEKKEPVSELEASLLAHLAKHHDVDHALLGVPGALAFVREAVRAAGSHGFGRPDDVSRYLDLMIILGSGFDDDPQLAWASRALGAPSKTPMALVWKEAVRHVRECAGAKGERYLRALLRARKLASTPLVATSWLEAEQAVTLLESVHTEKLRLMRSELELAFGLAERCARRHDPSGKGVRPIYLLLMFLLGGHFERDLRYAWAAEILGDASTPIASRYQALHARALTELEGALELMGKTDASVEG